MFKAKINVIWRLLTMKRLKRAAAALMAMAMVVGMTACGPTGGKKGEQETKKIVNDKGEEVEVKVFSAFFAVPGN